MPRSSHSLRASNLNNPPQILNNLGNMFMEILNLQDLPEVEKQETGFKRDIVLLTQYHEWTRTYGSAGVERLFSGGAFNPHPVCSQFPSFFDFV